MRFKGYYDANRFRFIDKELVETLVDYEGGEKYRKTGCFYSEDMNFYIDTSDGINEDLNFNEYLDRIMWIVKDAKGKKFIVFKSSFSKVKSADLVQIARQNNGDVLPFFIMSYYPDFDNAIKNSESLLKQRTKSNIVADIGFCSGLGAYHYPSADGKNERKYILNAREKLYSLLLDSKFELGYHSWLTHGKYLEESLKWKVHLNVPGIGEYSGRMLEASLLGEAVVSRKHTYDNAISYKPFWPEVDFKVDGWEDELQKIVDNYVFWGKMSRLYWDTVYKPELMVGYIKSKLLQC